MGPITNYDVAYAILLESRTTTWPAQLWLLDDRPDGQTQRAAEWLAKQVDRINAIRNLAEDQGIELREAAVRYRRLVEGETYGR